MTDRPLKAQERLLAAAEKYQEAWSAFEASPRSYNYKITGDLVRAQRELEAAAIAYALSL